jgi:hypothetical protein
LVWVTSRPVTDITVTLAQPTKRSTTGGPDETIATMARWFAGFGLFFSDIWHHTVGRLSGVLSVVLAILGFALPAFFVGEPGLRHSRWAFELAALLSFTLAAYSAWKEQHRQVVEQHQKVVETQQKLDDRRPRIAFSVAPSRARLWKYESGLFTLAHLGGDAAQFIQIQPIQSVRGGKLWVTFGQVDFLDQTRNVAHPGFDLDIGGEVGNKFINDKSGNLYYVFFKREAPSQQTVDYRIKVMFRWNEKWLEENVVLRWHTLEEVLTTLPEGSSTSI